MRFFMIFAALTMPMSALGAPRIETGILKPGMVKPNTPRQLSVDAVDKYALNPWKTILLISLYVAVPILDWNAVSLRQWVHIR